MTYYLLQLLACFEIGMKTFEGRHLRGELGYIRHQPWPLLIFISIAVSTKFCGTDNIDVQVSHA